MNTLVFDTETTGLVDFKGLHDLERQPSIVTLCACLYDAQKVERSCVQVVVRTTRDIPLVASGLHGITNATSNKCGIPIASSMIIFAELWNQADIHVAHNANFDLAMIGIEEARLCHNWRKQGNIFDTMLTMTPICKLPKKQGGGYKWPKLSEAYKFAFGEEIQGAHNSLNDVRATARLYFWMQDNGYAPSTSKALMQPCFDFQSTKMLNPVG